MTALLLLAALAAPVRAQEDGEADGSSREDDLFGESAPTAPGEGISEAIRAADQRLTVGGRLYLRGNAYVPEDPGLDEVALDSPNLLDLYVDARPNDQLRAFAQARTTHDPTVPMGSVALDQLWVNASAGGRVFVTAGQQRIKWGAGRFWNPTDFLDPARLDALAFFDERTGVPLLKVHVPFEKAGWNLYGLAGFDGASTPDRIQGAFRAEWLVGLTEMAVSAALRKGDPERFGAQVSTGLGPIDLKGEVALTHGLDTPGWTGRFDWTAFEWPTEVDRSGDWIPQVVAGAEWGVRYSDRDSLYLGVEYFYNDLGYDDPDLYAWLAYQNQFTPFYLGRHYGGAYVYLPAPGRADDHTFVLSTLGNLSDRSFVSRLDWSARLVTELSVNAYTQVHYGELGGEFRLEVDVPEIPEVLPDGLFIPAPLVDVGVGAAVRF